MAIYTTFFLCELSALQSAFPRWKPPLAEPVVRQGRDPFTGKLVSRESREPVWPDEREGASSPPSLSVVSVPAKAYATYLEARIPPAVRALPHWCAKGLTQTELEPLAAFLKVDPLLETALYAPPSIDALLFRVNPSAQAALAHLTGDGRQAASAHWSAVMSDDQHTVLGSGDRLPGWSIAEASAYLSELCTLVKHASTAQALHLLIE